MSKQAKTMILVLSAVIVLGGGNTIATWVRGEHSQALGSLGLVALIAVLLLLAAHRESLRRQLLDTDERSNAIGLFAGAWAGFALFCTLFAVYLVEFARGHSGEPYYWAAMLYPILFILIAIGRRVRH